jgi:hypothetical protein
MGETDYKRIARRFQSPLATRHRAATAETTEIQTATITIISAMSVSP